MRGVWFRLYDSRVKGVYARGCHTVEHCSGPECSPEPAWRKSKLKKSIIKARWHKLMCAL